VQTDLEGAGEVPPPRLGWKAVALAVTLYLFSLMIATWPRALSLGSCLPERYDSLQHLWIMRWYKTCLIEGRSVFLCREIQHPIGAPLGNFSSLHLQALLYLPLSMAIANDALCYNIIWVLGPLTTALGTFVLGWYLLRDRTSAAFGGLLAMLNTPLLMHAHVHLELIYVGGFPLFLVAWMRFVDRPGKSRLAMAALGYVVVAMSAAYFLVFAIFPAALYVFWQALRGGWKPAWPWLKERAPWLLGFAAAALPLLLVLFSSQFWALAHGHELERPRYEFEVLGAPLWSYFAPTRFQRLHVLFRSDPYAALGESTGERASYLGVVTLALLLYAAVRRVRYRNSGYLWAALAFVVVLSLGAYAHVGRWRINLPSDWLWRYFPVYRVTRAPARFNLFAGVLAGVLAAAGLRHLLARVRLPGWRPALLVGLSVAALADLAMIPFWMETIPEMPACYNFIKQRDPNAAILEIPISDTGGSTLNACCTYWQALHRLTTKAGYSGHVNAPEDARTGHNSPFHEVRLAKPSFLADPAHVTVDVTTGFDYKDFVWLYLTVNRFDYIVLHQWASPLFAPPVLLDRLKVLLAECKIYDDGATIVYARSLLRPPVRPVPICLEEWQERSLWQGRFNCRIPNSARIVVYNPDPTRDLTLRLALGSPVQNQVVRIRSGPRVLARWDVRAEGYQDCLTPPFRLAAGLQHLTIDCDIPHIVTNEPTHVSNRARKPRRIRIASIRLDDSGADDGPLARQAADSASTNRSRQ
jgi:hypothetical protein